MKRNRFSSRKRISADATELSRLAIGLAESGSKIEDQFWQGRLVQLVNRLFQDGTEDDFSSALDRLFDAHPMAHDDLADIIEANAESTVVTHAGRDFDILLIATPVLAWSRFSIPVSAIRKAPCRRSRSISAHTCSPPACACRLPTTSTARINCHTALSIPGN
jgi:hypothetical protein